MEEVQAERVEAVPAARKTVSYQDCKAARERAAGVPLSHIVQSPFFKHDSQLSLWIELDYGPDQTAEHWHDTTQKVSIADKKFSTNEMANNRKLPKLFSTGAALSLAPQTGLS